MNLARGAVFVGLAYTRRGVARRFTQSGDQRMNRSKGIIVVAVVVLVCGLGGLLGAQPSTQVVPEAATPARFVLFVRDGGGPPFVLKLDTQTGKTWFYFPPTKDEKGKWAPPFFIPLVDLPDGKLPKDSAP